MAVPVEDHPGTPLMHARLWAEDPEKRGRPRRSRRSSTSRRWTCWTPIPDPAHDGRGWTPTTPACRPAGTPRRYAGRESLRISQDAGRLGIADGERVRVVSRRGAVEAPVALDPSLRPGLASFTTLHFTEEVDEPADQRRVGPEVGHVGVQGDRDPHREARRPALPVARQQGARGPSPVGGRAVRARANAVHARSRAAPWPTAHGDRPTRALHGGHAAAARRHLLLPVLHAVHRRGRRISEGALNHIARR